MTRPNIMMVDITLSETVLVLVNLLWKRFTHIKIK